MLVAIVGLGFLILIHEAGHFVTALAVGMRPRKFYVGFPPALVKVRARGVEYGLGAIPLGGYVKVPGMHRPTPGDVDIHIARAVREEPMLGRAAERVKRPLDDGDMEAAREELDVLAAKVADTEVSEPARRAADRGIRDLRDALGADAYWRQSTWRRIAFIFAGPATNFVFAVALLAVVFMVGAPVYRTVESVLPGTPADAAGLLAGDVILRVNDEEMPPGRVPDAIAAHAQEPITLVVRRDDRTVVLPPVRAVKIDDAYRLGFALLPRVSHEPIGVGRSVQLAVDETFEVTAAIGKSIRNLVTGGGREDVASVVGIVQGSSQAADVSFRLYLQILAFVSLSLALLNLLPLLPLDGGHIAFSLVEAVRGRAVGREVFERVSVVGIALVLLLFAIGLSNDIGRLTGG